MKMLISVIVLCMFSFGCRTLVLPPEEPEVSLFPTAYPVRILDLTSPWHGERSELSGLLAEAKVYDFMRSAGLTDATLDLAARGLRNKGYAEIDCRRACKAKKCPFAWVVFIFDKEGSLTLRVRYEKAPEKEQCLGLKAGYLSEAKRGSIAGIYGGTVDYYYWLRTEETREIGIYQIVTSAGSAGSEYVWDVVISMIP